MCSYNCAVMSHTDVPPGCLYTSMASIMHAISTCCHNKAYLYVQVRYKIFLTGSFIYLFISAPGIVTVFMVLQQKLTHKAVLTGTKWAWASLAEGRNGLSQCLWEKSMKGENVMDSWNIPATKELLRQKPVYNFHNIQLQSPNNESAIIAKEHPGGHCGLLDHLPSLKEFVF